MLGAVRLLVQLQHLAPMGNSPNTATREPESREIISMHMAAGKTARFPSEASAEKRGTDSP